MARYLKTEGKCPCGERVPVRRLRDVKEAKCTHCLEARRLFRLAVWKNDEAAKLRREAPPVDYSAVTAADLYRYLQAASCALQAAASACDAVAMSPRGHGPAVLRQWLAWANRKMAWGNAVSSAVLPLLEKARTGLAHGLEVIPGQRLSESVSEPPSLRLLIEESD